MERRKLDCLRCGTEMSFRENTQLVMNDSGWRGFESHLRMDIYICPKCGKIEFFYPVKPKEAETAGQDVWNSYNGPDTTGFYIPGVAEDVKCYQCGKEHPADDPFCPLCGMPTKKLEAQHCEWCGETLMGGEVRCPHCGAGLRKE